MPGLGKKMAPLHREKMRLSIVKRHRAYDLGIEFFRCQKIKDKVGQRNAFLEWVKLGQEGYEKLPRR